ncbi:MFS transporter [Aliikangiella maris]|uniref:MFS transporter n=2 Tax=Aliikangiella maris TaxID=3162458 RepID=A0ABV2BRI5_9GAMM
MFRDYYSFAKTNSHFLLFGLLTAFFGNFGQTFFIAWFGQSIQQTFQLSAVEYGLVYSAATLASGFIILFVGALLDKTPLKQFTFFTSSGLFIACLLIYFCDSIWQLAVALFLLRFCGQGLMFHIAYTSMARYFDKNRGKALGIVSMGMPIGEAILPIIAVVLIASVGWQTSWLILGITVAIIYWPLMHYFLEKSSERIQLFQDAINNQTSDSQHWNRSQVVKDPCFWSLIPLVMAPAFIVTGIFIHQSELLKFKSWSEEWFAVCFTIYAFAHFKSSVVVGSLVDKYGSKQLIQYFLLPMFAAVALLTAPINYPFMTVIFMFLLGVTIGSASPIVGSLWVEIYGNKNIGAIRSMVTSIMVVSTAISPALMGWLFDIGQSYQQVLIYLLIYQATAWILVKFYVLTKVSQRSLNDKK